MSLVRSSYKYVISTPHQEQPRKTAMTAMQHGNENCKLYVDWTPCWLKFWKSALDWMDLGWAFTYFWMAPICFGFSSSSISTPSYRFENIIRNLWVIAYLCKFHNFLAFFLFTCFSSICRLIKIHQRIRLSMREDFVPSWASAHPDAYPFDKR